MKQILLSIPHASLFIPKEINDLLSISQYQINNHSDIYTEKIFDIKWVFRIESKVSRLLLDVNRHYKDEIIKNIDHGWIISSLTPCWEKVFVKHPNKKIIVKLLDKYYFPYHKKIEEIIEKENIKFVFDCHSMWSVWPSALKDSWITRADIILGNRDYTTCSNDQTLFIKRYFENLWYQVSINDPYKWKEILKRHCLKTKTPWIQIEINRKLYLDESNIKPFPKKISLLNNQISNLVDLIHNKNFFI